MKPFLAKLAMLLLTLLILQILVGFLYPMEIPPEIVKFRELLTNEVEILYFGDSTVWHPRGSQTIPAMLQEYLTDRTVGEISHAAYNLDLYEYYVRGLVDATVESNYRPALVIIPINLHSFSPEWDRRPEYQFAEEKQVLDYGITVARLFGRPWTIFGGYNSPITTEEYLSTAVYSDTMVVGTVADFEDVLGNSRLEEKENARFIYYQALPAEGLTEKMLIYYYMFPLTADHRKVQAMRNIVMLLQQAEIEVLFYITPVDTEVGDVYLGESFRRRFTANKEVILDALAEVGAPVIDLSYALEPFYFSDTEHLHQEGKRYIAEQLVAQIEPSLIADDLRDGSADENIVGAQRDTTTMETPTALSTPTPLPRIDAIANPLLATAVARATEAAKATETK